MLVDWEISKEDQKPMKISMFIVDINPINKTDPDGEKSRSLERSFGVHKTETAQPGSSYHEHSFFYKGIYEYN